MAIPVQLKFDVRVRERLVGDGVLAESEVQKHLEGLPDLESQVVELTIKQPALQNESDRDIVIVRTSGVRPPVAPVRNADELDMPLDDDDDEELDPKKPEAKKPVEKAKPKAEEVAAADEDEDEDDDDDDEDEEKSESKDDEVDKDGGAEP